MDAPKQPTIKKHRSYSPKWSKDTERLILYADFMGFKNQVLGKPHEELKKELIDFHNKWVKRTSPLKAGGHLQFVQFSDSILIAVNGIDEKKFNLLSKAAICLMHVAMSMQIPIKGVIAQGMFSYDKENELYFGKPLVDAYLLHEELKYYGIVVHNTAEKTIKKYQNSNNPYTNTPIYIERGRTAHYHLCWNLINQQLAPENITPQCKKWIEDIAERISGYPRIYIDRTIEILEADERKFSLKEEHNAE